MERLEVQVYLSKIKGICLLCFVLLLDLAMGTALLWIHQVSLQITEVSEEWGLKFSSPFQTSSCNDFNFHCWSKTTVDIEK